MIYEFLYPLHTVFSSFNVFRYITFRTIFASITALLICLVLGRWFIEKLQKMQIDQQIREDGPQTHLVKKGTPTMGGMLILFAVTVSTILWANLSVVYIWLVLLVTVGFGLIGFLDDYRKLAVRNSRGVPGKVRLAAEIIIALFVGVVLYFKPGFSAQVTIPFFKTVLPNLGWGYILLCVFIIVGAANAVNLTDGLDGLATGPRASALSRICSSPILPATSKLRITCRFPMYPARVNCPFSAERLWARRWAFCGLTPIRRKSSWAMSALCPWAARWEPWPSSPNRKFFWRLSAGFL